MKRVKRGIWQGVIEEIRLEEAIEGRKKKMEKGLKMKQGKCW